MGGTPSSTTYCSFNGYSPFDQLHSPLWQLWIYGGFYRSDSWPMYPHLQKRWSLFPIFFSFPWKILSLLKHIKIIRGLALSLGFLGLCIIRNPMIRKLGRILIYGGFQYLWHTFSFLLTIERKWFERTIKALTCPLTSLNIFGWVRNWWGRLLTLMVSKVYRESIRM